MREQDQFRLAWTLICAITFLVGMTTMAFAPIHEAGHILFGILVGCIPVGFGWTHVSLVGFGANTDFVSLGGIVGEILGGFALWFLAWRKAVEGSRKKDWIWAKSLFEPFLLGVFYSSLYWLLIDLTDYDEMAWETQHVSRIVLGVIWAILAVIATTLAVHRVTLTKKSILRLNAPRVVAIKT